MAPLPKESSCLEGIDPGITALPVVPSFENDDFDLSDIMVSQFPVIADHEEDSGGVVTATAPSNPSHESSPHVLTPKPAMNTCEACMVGMMKSLMK